MRRSAVCLVLVFATPLAYAARAEAPSPVVGHRLVEALPAV